MYDTIRFWIKRGEVCPAGILLLLPNVRRHRNKQGIPYYYGKFKNFTVTVSKFGVFIQGSLAKYHFGNNIETLRFDQVENVLERLSNDFGVDLKTALVTRIDFSTVILTDQTPARYFKFLGKSGRCRRYLHPSKLSLYYNLNDRVLIFYDKTAEAQANGVCIPSEFVGQSLFRYELRFLRGARRQLKLPHNITGATLYDGDFYRLMVQWWHDKFIKISKINTMKTHTIKQPKQAVNAYLRKLALKEGQAPFDDFVMGVNFSDPKYRSRAKKMFNDLLTNPAGEKAGLVAELEVKIAEKAEQAHAETHNDNSNINPLKK